MDFNLSPDFLYGLYLGQRKKCFYSSARLNIKDISVDRIDSRDGYIKPNIVLCTKAINYAKHSLSKKEFYQMCNNVVNNTV